MEGQGSKGLAVLSYITWVGWLIALLARNKEDTLVKHHLNQALVLNLLSTVCGFLSRLGSVFGWIAGIVSIVCTVFWIWGIIRAIKGSEEPLPFIGELRFIS
ncbi:MAG: DUF4870 domain-containing protein [Lachnospiraceae bacterium]|nr:DUF4870 domain-containing protein [Lachnospiraceae bacterium]